MNEPFPGLAPPQIMALLSDEPLDLSDAYYAALGRFITEYAQTEMKVRRALQDLLKIGPHDTAALFHKWGLAECVEAINRLLVARGEVDISARLKEPFAQLQAIAEVRNALVHWQSTLEEGAGFVAVNSHRAHSPDKVKTYTVPIDQLQDFGVDLLGVNLHITAALYWDHISPEMKAKVVEPAVSSSWRYKRPL